MNTSEIKMEIPDVVDVEITDDTLRVDFSDGRTLSVPVHWFPRLVHASEKEQRNWRLIGRGEGIHWPDLDEDISAQLLLAGKPSGESQDSLKKWLGKRRNGVPVLPSRGETIKNKSISRVMEDEGI